MFRSSREGPTEEKAGGRTSIWLGSALIAAVALLLGPLAIAASAATTPHQATPVVEGSYVSVTPFRIVDTRTGATDPATYAGKTLAAATSLTVQVTGVGTVPVPAGSSAAVLNVTVTNPTDAGFLTVFPAGITMPPVSNLNFSSGETVANLVTVPLSATGGVSIYNSAGSTNVLVDVEGYYTSTPSTTGAGLYNALPPYRALGALSFGAPVAANTSVPVTVTGTATGVPATATAVVANVTAEGATLPSFLTVYPAGATMPVASNLNFLAQVKNQAIANRVKIGIGTNGQIEVYNHSGTVNVDVDVDGYYTGAGGVGSYYVPITPIRVADTRTASLVGTETPIAASTSESFLLATATSGIPTTAAAVEANFTVVPGAANGYLTVYPGTSTTTVPVASDVNWIASQSPVPNFTIADTVGTGSVEVYNSHGATINLVVDAFGYFGPPTTPVNTVALKATPNQVLNNGTSTSAITATVTGPSGVLAGDMVSVALVGTPAAACGTILPASVATTIAGVASFTYTSSTTVGFCTVTATEAQQGAKGTATVDQVTVVPPSSSYNITVIASPPTIPANSATTPVSTSTVTATVTGVATAPVVGDEVMFTLTGASCGTFTAGGDVIVPPGLEAFSATVAGGTTTPLTYTASDTPGTCTVSVQEANQAQVNSTVITQTPVGYVVTLAASPVTLTAGAPGIGNRSTLTANVTLKGVATNGDLVVFTLEATTGEPAGSCGTLPTVATTTGVPTVNGVATVTYYYGSSTVGFCGITATEQATSAKATTYVTENSGQSTANVNTALAVPATISANGTSTSAVTATVLGATHSAVSGDEVMFSLSGPTGVCGTFTGGLTTVFDVTGLGGETPVQQYTSTTVPGVCTVTVTEANSDVVNTATITQTPVVDGLTLLATPAYLTGNGLTASLITASVTYPAGGVMPGATVTFTLGACEPATLTAPMLSATTAITNAAGTASVTYTSSVGAGFCIVDASVGTAPTANTASVQIDQTSV